jgi:hypothetical protein
LPTAKGNDPFSVQAVQLSGSGPYADPREQAGQIDRLMIHGICHETWLFNTLIAERCKNLNDLIAEGDS